ncbi:GntR family transcriptional regulator [Roseimicrobium gellanilyticum]|uniref:GntR family transcriptional regulator n=1 Tax=Roseimicrobium gellanilyticum TaxID=748857 RepID=A0A366H9R1_9BACT|nr:FCD domain-containing protein [Roseimicrobium gellanilyticum]RBP39031.1 GntR family transcriptional regulator [Roseimicrobium gellanilyticum]
MNLAAIQRPSTLVEEVSQRLAKELRRDRAEEWLPAERELANQLGVSRTVVREATKRLELQGLVEVQHGVGIRRSGKLHKPLNGSLALLIPDEAGRLTQSLEVRLAIEPEVARLATSRVSTSQMRDLRKVHARLENAVTLPEAVEADIDFHRALARATGNEIFSLLLETLSDLGRESRMATISHAGVKRAIEHHAAILHAVEAKDEAGAARAMQHHIEVAVQDLAAGQSGGRKHRTKKTPRTA